MPVLNQIILVFVAVGLVACQPQTPRTVQSSHLSSQEVDRLFSNEPQAQMPTIAVIKLNTPPLLPNVIEKDGLKVADPDLLDQINKEQEEMISKLLQISSELQTVFRYRWLINGIAFTLPPSLVDAVTEMIDQQGAEFHPDNYFGRPEIQSLNEVGASQQLADLVSNTTTAFIGATRAHQELGITGKGVKIGVIDTGIDYTHAAFGGEGTKEAYLAALELDDPTGVFPNKKVVGGMDFVGTQFGSSTYIPFPDLNPIDQAGHGTHVAGTIAGIGDGINTYDGVAPDAELYALKVFGAGGGTSDSAILAALEYSVDPKGLYDLSNQLDVVNLSLGSDFGQPHTLYQEAIKLLVENGTFVVAAAGNSGPEDFVVGSPSTTLEALSVAASIDDMPHNIQFPVIAFTTPTLGAVKAEALEGPVSKPIRDAGDVRGKLVYIGLADKAPTGEVAEALKGQIALIDRGINSFVEKLQTAQKAGAIGAVVVNNEPGPAIPMGGDGNVPIPAVMVTQAIGMTLKDELSYGDVSVQFKNDDLIEKPELIDTMAPFSSKGPRFDDVLLKPEISAPGSEIISAEMGSGNKGIKQSGTSMAAPQIAGVIGLLKQAHGDLSNSELKSLVMGTAKTMFDESGQPYSVTMQGAGRVQVYEALTQKLVFSESGISLGLMDLSKDKSFQVQLTVKNISDGPLSLTMASETGPMFSLKGEKEIQLAAGETKSLVFEVTVNKRLLTQNSTMAEGFLKYYDSATKGEVARIPVLGVFNKTSEIKAQSLTQTSENTAELSLINQGTDPGTAYVFNFLGEGGRKERSGTAIDSHLSVACDLESAGYRIIEKEGAQGEKEQVLQIAAKITDPVAIWRLCELSVQFDKDGDGVTDYELGGTYSGNVGINVEGSDYLSVLLDYKLARQIRGRFEMSQFFGFQMSEDYTAAAISTRELIHYDYSTLIVVEASLKDLPLTAEGDLAIKVATLHLVGHSLEPYDYLSGHEESWAQIPADATQTAYYGMPERVNLDGQESKSIELKKGLGKEQAIIYMPLNERQSALQSTLLQ